MKQYHSQETHNMSRRSVFKQTILTLSTALLMATSLQGQAVTLDNEPLFASSSTTPNIMFLFDDTRSMLNIVIDTPYDATATYSCPATDVTAATAGVIDVFITDDGYPFFYSSGLNNHYGWSDTTSANAVASHYGLSLDPSSGLPNRCFNPTDVYSARLYASDQVLTTLSEVGLTGSDKVVNADSTYPPAQYTGKYLNWYFSSWDTYTAGAVQHPSSKTRLEVAKTAIGNVVSTLTGANVGFTRTGTSGAILRVECDDISDSGHRAELQTEIASSVIETDEAARLAKALLEVGGYFTGRFGTNNPGHQTTADIVLNGQYEGNLSLVDHSTDPTGTILVNDDSLFAPTSLSPEFTFTNASSSTAESPNAYSCQENFVVYITDGGANSDVVPTVLSDYDGDGNSDANQALDDVSLMLYEVDLRPDIDNTLVTPTTEIVNNITTHVIGFENEDGTPSDAILEKTASNGGGVFLTASNAAELTEAFTQATNAIIDQIGSASAVSFNSGTLSKGSHVFLSQFNTSGWYGELIAYALDENTGAVEGASWTAGSKLDKRTPASRKIFTYRPYKPATTGPSSTPAVPEMRLVFSTGNYGSFSAEMKDDLTRGGSDTDTEAQARVDYLRGDKTHEGSSGTYNFRPRTHILGDIIHGGPVYVGEPELSWPATDDFSIPGASPTDPRITYNDFFLAKKNRVPAVYVGSNDGMLHAFRAEDASVYAPNGGSELFAYIPNALASSSATAGLHYLTDPNYQHRYYVDLNPIVSDIIHGTEWKTVLVGGLRGGGRGYFALDITDPTTFAASKVMWEFTPETVDGGEPYLGNSFSTPVVAKFNNGKWGVVFGNGYMASNPDTTDGEAALFILFFDADTSDGWDRGSDYVRIIATNSTTETTSSHDNPNGLSSPAVIDTTGDGIADRVYAGDLQGNMWAFDLSSTSAGSWDVAYRQSGNDKPLYQGSTNQPITSVPIIYELPAGSGEYLVMFGTGRYLGTPDKDTSEPSAIAGQAFYGVLDTLASTNHSITTSNLQEQTISTSSGKRILTDEAVNGSEKGWYITLSSSPSTPVLSERVVADPLVRGKNIFFNTIIPSSKLCSYGGSGWMMAAAIENGGRPNSSIFDTNGDGKVDDTDMISSNVVGGIEVKEGLPTASRCLGNKCYTPNTKTKTGSDIQTIDVEDLGGLDTGRLSWHELSK